MKELMIHVEKIVRPVRATQRRKLQMRRELLAHLQAALEEERAGRADEVAALAAAKARLGEPADLTRSLQRSVPRLERVLLARVPVLGWMNRLEQEFGGRFGMRGMSTGQQLLLALGTEAILFGPLILLGLRLVKKYRAVLLLALGEPTRQREAGLLLADVLLLVMLWAAFSIAEAAANGRWRGRSLAGVALIIGSLVAWPAVIVGMVAGQPIDILDLLMGLVAGILASLMIAGLGRWVGSLRNPYREWLILDVAA